MEIKLASFDLEIAKVVTGKDTDWKAQRPLGISCAAVARETGHLFEIDNWDGRPQMSQATAQQMVLDLGALCKNGYTLVTWNGAGFDFDVLAEESGLLDQCAWLALNHVDLMYVFVTLNGHYLGLDAACKGMEIQSKAKSVKLNDGSLLFHMDGAKAPALWAKGEYTAVIDYLSHDVRATLQLAQAVKLFGFMRWTSSKGRNTKFAVPELYTVKQCLEMRMPRPKWVTQPPNRREMISWIPDEVLNKWTQN